MSVAESKISLGEIYSSPKTDYRVSMNAHLEGTNRTITVGVYCGDGLKPKGILECYQLARVEINIKTA